VPKGGQLGGGAHRTRHEARLVGGGVGIGHLPCQFGGAFVDREGLILKVVLRQHDRSRPEGVRLDHIAADVQELAVDRLHRVGPREHEVLVAALQGQAAEILGAEVHLLERGARGAIEHQHGVFGTMQALEETDPLGGQHQPFRRTRVTQWS